MRKLIGKLLPEQLKTAICGPVVDSVQARRIEISERLFARFDGVIAYGPFKGMRLLRQVFWGSPLHSHKLLGIYEKELLESMFDIPASYRTFIDIGSQDGYYAVGFLRAGLFDHAHCFEILEEGRQLTADYAAANGVRDKVSIYGAADTQMAGTLKAAGADLAGSVVLCDIEAGEFDIFDAAMFETLKGAIIFIELHPFAVQDGQSKIAGLKQAAGTHYDITELTTTSRDMSVFPELDSLSDTDRWLICSEGRPERMTWLRLDPK